MNNYIDENIKNLDITKNYIYVLKLIDDRYYIGRTSNIIIRLEQHFTNNGSIYTKMYNPLNVIEIEEELTKDAEKAEIGISSIVTLDSSSGDNLLNASISSLANICPLTEFIFLFLNKKLSAIVSKKSALSSPTIINKFKLGVSE